MVAIFLLMLIIAVSYFQVKSLLKEKNKKDAYIYIGLMLLATYLSVGQLLDVYIPNPTNGLEAIFKPVQDWIFKLLG